MSATSDLFPETLVVELINGQPMTNSLMIAEHFDKRHDNVLKTIRALVSRTNNPERLLNFKESSATFTSANGAQRKRPIYLLTRKGFDFIVTGFTGEKAEEWKWQFLDAFEAMEAELHARTARYAAALDAVRPNLRPVTEATERGYSRADIGLLLDKSPASISYHRRSARRLGLLTV